MNREIISDVKKIQSAQQGETTLPFYRINWIECYRRQETFSEPLHAPVQMESPVLRRLRTGGKG